MKIILTGASSFTGMWFARKLVERGFEVVAPLQRSASSYEGMRAERVAYLRGIVDIRENISFGDDRFLELIDQEGAALLCHHAAQVGDYRSPDFDVAQALAANTRNFRQIAERLAAGGGLGVVGTGSVFEHDEGCGEAPLRSFSPYGMSKGFTNRLLAEQCARSNLAFGKFVIANPFGPFEEPRFCAYLMKTWANGEQPEVKTPDYVRDNIHVEALALAYAEFVSQMCGQPADRYCAPTMFAETQGAFAQRFAQAMASRFGRDWTVSLGTQTDFSEPTVRIGKSRFDWTKLGFDQARAWDELAAFYRPRLGLG